MALFVYFVSHDHHNIAAGFHILRARTWAKFRLKGVDILLAGTKTALCIIAWLCRMLGAFTTLLFVQIHTVVHACSAARRLVTFFVVKIQTSTGPEIYRRRCLSRFRPDRFRRLVSDGCVGTTVHAGYHRRCAFHRAGI